MCEGPPLNFAGYEFDSSKGSFACSHVWEQGAPVLLFVHDPDGDIQFMCGAAGHEGGDCTYLHAHHILERQPDLYDLPTVDMGYEAERSAVGEPWVVSESAAYEE